MEEDYNWEWILKIALPVALVEAYIFYTNISNIWKWLSLITGLAMTGYIISVKDKRRSSIFTAIGLVFLAALIVRLMKNFGVF